MGHGRERYRSIMEPRWLDITDADDGVSWRFDIDFLSSRWTCIWGMGCQGILDRLAPELKQGCCSVGAECFDEGDALDVVANAACIPDGMWQFQTDEPLERRDNGRWHTKVVDGACVFFNRPGFEAGEGCALHLGAVSLGERPLDWKPDVCWEVPLHVSVEDGVNVVRPWARPDWGDDPPAWWCTESDSGAFVGHQPVYLSLADELREMCGDSVYDGLAQYLNRTLKRNLL
jgi:hypothetical protein